jgi:ElaB/YqjD/DUF883 family membrane-anchored ribosome-binding protein
MSASPESLAALGADRSAPPPHDEQQEIARLEDEIARRRVRVGDSLAELRRRVDGATNWRHWAASHPLGWIGAGVSVGFVVGWLAGRRSRSEP